MPSYLLWTPRLNPKSCNICLVASWLFGIRLAIHKDCLRIMQAYDLAKRKGYLVQRALSRRYPLVNTYRNFCNASNQLCIFIEQVQGTLLIHTFFSPRAK